MTEFALDHTHQCVLAVVFLMVDVTIDIIMFL